VVGIANESSIAWAAPMAARARADIAVTYLNDKTKRFTEPLAQKLEAPIFMPLDVGIEGQTEAVFERIKKTGAGSTFSCIRSRSRQEALHGRWSTCRRPAS